MNIHKYKEDYHPDDWPEPRIYTQYEDNAVFFIGLEEARLARYFRIGNAIESNFTKEEWKFILEARKIGKKFRK